MDDHMMHGGMPGGPMLNPAVRAAWQAEHIANAMVAAQATANAVALAQAQMTAQTNAHAVTVGELQVVLAQLAVEVGALPDALAKVQLCQTLAAQL